MSDNHRKWVFETADDSYYSLLKQYAEENKLIMTEAESALWSILKSKNLGCKFRRQHIVGVFIADFINLHYKLIVEVDGKYHFYKDQPVSDAQRTDYLNRNGYTVVRFTNEEVLHKPHYVVRQLQEIIKNMEISYPKNTATETKTQSSNNNTLPNNPLPYRGGVAEGRGEAWARNAWAVDAACSGNPGPMEYQCVDLQTGERIFHFGPLTGTNNIGEFLAIVHALALMEQRGIKGKAIYSDSYNAILWVNKKQCKTKLELTEATQKTHELVRRAEEWLRKHAVTVPIVKWETKSWGEIPADFGRKK